MSYNDYEYDYHNLAENADYIDQSDDNYYDSGTDEPWMNLESEDNESDWENYYHNLNDEID